MELKDMFQKSISFFNQNLSTKEEVIDFLSQKLVAEGLVKDEKAFKDAVWKREEQGSTGIGEGIAIPHVLNPTVQQSAIAFVSLKNEVEWQSLDDKPVSLVFLIITNGKDGNEHLEALANLSGYLIKSEVQEGLRSAKSVTTVQKLLSAPKEVKAAPKSGHYDVIGITACPTGIAHTYLAAEKIAEYADQLGLTAKVETQGRRGIDNKLTDEDIANAKYIILAHDKAITGMSRFNGKEVIDTTTKDAIYNGKTIISEYKNQKTLKSINNVSSDGDSSGELTLGQFKKVKDNLLAGVSRMLPFVVAGGIILGLGFLLDYIYLTANGFVGITGILDGMSEDQWGVIANGGVLSFGGTTYYASGNFGTVWIVAHFFSAIGKIGMELMIPILAAYVCYSLVGAQGLMPGAVAGLMANGDGFVYGAWGSWSGAWTRFLPDNLSGLSSGFIGALVGAYLAGLAVLGLSRLMKNFGKGLQGVRDIVFIPVLSLLAIAVIMLAINIPLGYVMLGLQKGITFLAEKNLFWLVCIIIGAMMCVDMGGPINKIAYVLGTLSVGFQLVQDQASSAYQSQTMVMTAAMVAGMIPPLGIALSTVLFPRQWSEKNRDAAKANWLMGMCFISEGAIPFMIEDPKRIMGSAVAGGAVSGAIVGIFKITINAPHGGIFVSPLTNSLLFSDSGNETLVKAMGVLFFLVALIAGTITMAFILGFWRLADIKAGKLTLSGSNGVKASLEAKLAKFADDAKKQEIFRAKLAKYDQYEAELIVKQAAHKEKVATRIKQIEAKKASK